MKDPTTTGPKNGRLSTEAFISWLDEMNERRGKELYGIEKYIMGVDRSGNVTSITTLNGSVYTISCDAKTHQDLRDLTGYRVTLYPMTYDEYDLEAYFLWHWDRPRKEPSFFGHIVVNKVLDITRSGRDGLILFENGDILLVPFKDYEKPYSRLSKRMHGEDFFREGYAIDFEKEIQEMKSKFVGEYVVYNTQLSSIDIANYTGKLEVHRKSAFAEYSERDKYSFRSERGVIKSYGTWDSFRIPIYLEDGRVMTFSLPDHARHLGGSIDADICRNLKQELKTETGKSYKFTVIFGGDKDENGRSMDIVSLEREDDGRKLP